MQTTLFSFRQFSERHPAFRVGGLRHLAFHRHENGLSKSGAILNCGRKLLIDERRFFDWMDSKNNIAKEAQP